MSTVVGPEESKNKSLRLLRAIALIAVVAGAVTSLGITLYKGRNNPSALLMILFAGWVLSPFLALLVANVLSQRWSVPTRVTLYILMLIITLGSLLGYGGAFSSPETKNAFVFLVAPLISWILIVTVIPIATSLARRRSS